MINTDGKKRNSVLRIASPGSGSTSILAKLFRQIIYSTGIAAPNLSSKGRGDDSFVIGDRWNKLMEDFLSDSRNSIPQNMKERSSARGNLQKEITGNKGMSWKVFCKALRFLGIIKFDIIINVKFEGNHLEYSFKETVNLGHRVPYVKELPLHSPGSFPLRNVLSGRVMQASEKDILDAQTDNHNRSADTKSDTIPITKNTE